MNRRSKARAGLLAAPLIRCCRQEIFGETMHVLNIKGDAFHPDCNDTISPEGANLAPWVSGDAFPYS